MSPSRRGRPAHRTVAAVIVIVLVATACRAAARSDPESPPVEGATPTATPTTAPTPVPTPDASGPAVDRPPDATLAADGGDPVVGQLGSYTWGDGGSDSPWLPGATIAVGASEPLTVRVAGDVPVGSWSARRSPADDATGADARPIGEGGSSIAFAAPGPGAWTVEVVVRYRDGGSATYAWHLDVS